MSKSKNLNIYPKKILYKILKIRRVWHRVLNKGSYLSYRPLPIGFETSDTVINSCIGRYAPIRYDPISAVTWLYHQYRYVPKYRDLKPWYWLWHNTYPNNGNESYPKSKDKKQQNKIPEEQIKELEIYLLP